MTVATGVANVLLGRLPSYTRKSRHLQQLLRYAQPRKLANIARAELAMARGEVVLKSRPYIYTVDTGNVCNLRCPLCPTGVHGLERRQSLMKLATFQTILEKIRPWALEVVLHNWGEPFLNPDILEIIASAKTAGVGSTISSNLNLVHRGDDFLRSVVDSGLDHLTVSLDGTTREVYEVYRKGGDFEAVLQNMRTVIEYRDRTRQRTPTVEWQFLVMKHNEHQVETAKRLARQLGVDRLRLTSAGLAFDQLADTTLASQWLSTLPEYRAYHPEKIGDRGYMFDERCFYLYRGMTVNPAGEVSPCCVVYHSKYDFGNLVTDDLEAVWNNAHYRSSRGLFSPKRRPEDGDTVCGSCPLFKYESVRHR